MSVKYYELCQNLYKEFEMSEQKSEKVKQRTQEILLAL